MGGLICPLANRPMRLVVAWLDIVVVAKQVFGGDPLVAKATNASLLVTLSTSQLQSSAMIVQSIRFVGWHHFYAHLKVLLRKLGFGVALRKTRRLPNAQIASIRIYCNDTVALEPITNQTWQELQMLSLSHFDAGLHLALTFESCQGQKIL